MPRPNHRGHPNRTARRERALDRVENNLESASKPAEWHLEDGVIADVEYPSAQAALTEHKVTQATEHVANLKVKLGYR